MAETIEKNRNIYRIWDAVNKRWNKLNFLTNAKSVDADDGKTLQDKVGAIDGITSDLNGESETIAASIKCVNTLNKSLPQFIYDTSGEITGYKTSVGADTVFPFSSGIRIGNFDKLDDQVKCFALTGKTVEVFCSNKILPILASYSCWHSAGFSMGAVWSIMICDSLGNSNIEFKAQLGGSFIGNLRVEPLSDYVLSSTTVSSYTVAETGDEIVGWRFLAKGSGDNKATLRVWYVENTDKYYFDDIYVPSHAYFTDNGGGTSADSQIPHSLV